MTGLLEVDRTAAEVWRRVPVEGAGYLDSAATLRLSDVELQDLIVRAEIERYQGWRNYGNWWMDNLLQMSKRWGHTTGSGERGSLAATEDRGPARVIDYGCGFGLEAGTYGRAGADVYLADISEQNVALAARVVSLMAGPDSIGGRYVIGRDEFDESVLHQFDIVHCVGVLHHIRYPGDTMRLFHELVRLDGELRLMLYSDLAWEQATGTDVEESSDPELRRLFIAAMDHGDVPWSTWYDHAKLERLFGEQWHIAKTTYLEPDHRYLAAVLEPR
jgi:SAM-dependent methyltransferase